MVNGVFAAAGEVRRPSFTNLMDSLLSTKETSASSTWRVRGITDGANLTMSMQKNTGFSSEIGTKLCDWAVGQAWGSCYSWAALSSNDSKMLYLK